MIPESGLILLQSSDNPLEGCSNIGEVGNSTANDQHLAIRMFLSGHERKQSSGIVIGLLFRGCTTVLSIVCQLSGASQGTDGVRVDD